MRSKQGLRKRDKRRKRYSSWSIFSNKTIRSGMQHKGYQLTTSHRLSWLPHFRAHILAGYQLP